jgi:hypothetical protein
MANMNQIQLPVAEGRQILVNTVLSIGHSQHRAEQLADSALWLQQRNGGGVAMLIVYLAFAKGVGMDARYPRFDGDDRLHMFCPVMGADMLAKYFQIEGPPDRMAKVFGPAAPFLMAPLLVEYASSIGKALRLYANSVQVRYTANGSEFESGSFGMYAAIDETCRERTTIEFIEPFELPAPEPLEFIELPKKRMVTLGVLSLDDVSG